MKRGRSSYSDCEEEYESEIQSISVSNYHLVDDEDNPVSFAVLPIQWNDSENSSACEEKVFLHGDADSGLLKTFMQVTAWRFDLSKARPEVFLLAKDGRWVKLQKPRKSFQEKVRTVLITLHFLHSVKGHDQKSVGSFWQDLSKDKELISYGSKPSKNDLSDHMLLIGEASKRDAVLAKSKLFLVVLEKLKSQKLLNEEVNDFELPGFPVVGTDSDMIDKSNEESEETDVLDVCALCDNGGNVTCCDGVCMRSFHATVAAGRENCCVSLGFTQKAVDEIDNFYCKNCEYRQHQCFACGKLGSSDKLNSAEVFKCTAANCDRFYHPRCVAKLLPMVVKHTTEEFERNIADGIPFTCPLHYCCVCKGLENMMDPELQFAVCRRCPKAYHRKCLPTEINAENNDILRAWEGLLPKNRILIYCLNHEIDPELGTPVRDHIKFPKMKATAKKNDTTIEQKKPSTKKMVKLKKNIDSDNSPGKSTSTGSKLTAKLSSDKVGTKKSSNKRISSSNMSKNPKKPKPKSKEASRCLTENKMSILKKFEILDTEQTYNQLTVGKNDGSKQIERGNQINKVNTNFPSVEPSGELSIELPPLDTGLEKSLLALFKEASSSITLETVLEKHTHSHSLRNVLEKTTTTEKLEDSSVSGGSIQDAKAVCDPDVLKQIFKWKIADKLHWYVQNGDTIVNLSCGADNFSILMKKRLQETGKRCSYRNYGLHPTKNDFSFERKNWMTVQQNELPTGSQLIIGLSPPFGHNAALANKFIDKALEFKPKLLILTVAPEIQRLDKKLSRYDLIWEDENFLSDRPINLPGSVDANDRQTDQRNVRPPVLSLWSRSDWTTKHKVIAQQNAHELSTTEKLKSDTLAAAVHAPSGNCADNSKLTDEQQEDQVSVIDDVQNRNCRSSCNNVEEHKKGKPEKSRKKRKRVDESKPAKRQAVNKIPNGVPDHTEQPNPIKKTGSSDSDHTEQPNPTKKTGSSDSEPRTFIKSDSSEHSRGSQPGYVGRLHGFAVVPNYVYASQHSCGWLEE
ncbi:protein ENHANCED DOWNY MILDEW 2-like isoform X2 [Vigna unguiculata]|uniref:protein ENHANCED DOWNY MILDEW 2-like isoform X2 n=1 Tax=Vigna unguiculata TaxID=3917 RepID=UPI001016D0D7|nr:protein ENHANCED DOWNY MILDEW 2-like isoform X2 [Vigna unguiculata]